MKKRSDRDPLGITLALFDRGSGAFRQKMFNHFQSKGRQLLKEIEIIPNKNKSYRGIPRSNHSAQAQTEGS